jgi:hypothetical protein
MNDQFCSEKSLFNNRWEIVLREQCAIVWNIVFYPGDFSGN